MDSINCLSPLSDVLIDIDEEDDVVPADESCNFDSYSTPKPSSSKKRRRLGNDTEDQLDNCIMEVAQQLKESIDRPSSINN